MAHGGDPGRRPRAVRTSAEGASMAVSPTTARPSRLARRGACCSTAHYRRDDRAPAARELQLIREARRREAARLGGLPGRVRAAAPSSAREPISLPLTRRTPALYSRA